MAGQEQGVDMTLFFGGFFIGLMVCSAGAMVLHRRELRRIKDDPAYLDYLLGD